MTCKSITVISVLALMSSPACTKDNPNGGGGGPKYITATATITISNGVCTQTVSGASPNDFPKLSENGQDTIRFKGTAAALGVTVTFPGPAANFPFQYGTFTNGGSSGPPTGATGKNYPYQDVIIGYGPDAVHCSNPQSMGIHIN